MDDFDIRAKKEKGPPKPMPWKERKWRFGDQSCLLVQDKGGGSASVATKAYSVIMI